MNDLNHCLFAKFITMNDLNRCLFAKFITMNDLNHCLFAKFVVMNELNEYKNEKNPAENTEFCTFFLLSVIIRVVCGSFYSNL